MERGEGRGEGNEVVGGLSSSDGGGGLLALPWELQLEVCGWLSASQLCLFGSACRALREAANDPTVWRSLCQRQFNIARVIPSLSSAKSTNSKYDFSYWNEWKRAYHRWSKMAKGWSKKPRHETVTCSHSITSLWVDMRKIFALGAMEITAFDADTDKKTRYAVPTRDGTPTGTRAASVQRGRSSERYGLVIGAGGGGVVIWDLHSQDVKSVVETGLKFSIMDMCINDKTVYIGGGDKIIGVIDVEAGKQIISGGIQSGHTTDIRSLSVNEDLIASGGGYSDNTVKVWDARAPLVPIKELKDFKSGIWALHLSDTRLGCGSYNHACMFDIRMWESVWNDPSAHDNHINYIGFDDLKMVTGSGDKTIKAWNVQTFQPWWSIDLGNMVWFCGYEDDILAAYSSGTDVWSRLYFTE